VRHVHSMHLSSSMHFSCYTLPPSTHLNHSQQQLSSFFSILIVSVHHVHAMCNPSACTSPLHVPPHRDLEYHSSFPPLHFLDHPPPLSILHALFMSSAMPDHHCDSSASLAVKSMCSSPLGVMPRFLSLFSSRDSSSSLSQSSSFSLLQLQASTLFHLSIASMNSLHSTSICLEPLQHLWKSS
jgi:hypothetical protein